MSASPPQPSAGDTTPPGLTASLELVTRAQAGDGEARERLFARYYPRVFRIVRARLGVGLRALESPEDIVQNTFLAALAALERFEAREDAALIDWFARLTENQIRTAAKYHEALKRSGRAQAVEDGPDALEPAAPGSTPLEALTQAEEARLLDECIAELPEEEREALVLREHADASWALIAERLARPSEGAARELHRRAQLRLMERFRHRTGR
ncbi:MAG: sigma-70 family RNA polymerase sigma factor [Planctomycetota bacterium]